MLQIKRGVVSVLMGHNSETHEVYLYYCSHNFDNMVQLPYLERHCTLCDDPVYME
jgi:hypothetical protein